jgi:hypothetical protein
MSRKRRSFNLPRTYSRNAVVRTTANWKYQRVAEPVEGIVQIPFQLSATDEGYAFSTDARSLAAPAPSSVSELSAELTEGWSHVRLLINGSGAVEGTLVLKSSGDDFNTSCRSMLSSLKFTPAPEGVEGYKATSPHLSVAR